MTDRIARAAPVLAATVLAVVPIAAGVTPGGTVGAAEVIVAEAVAVQSEDPAANLAPSGTEPPAAGGPPAVPQPILDVGPVSGLATTLDGQTIFWIEPDGGSILAFDLFASASPRLVVSPPTAGGPRPVALAALDASILVTVCRQDDDWSLRSWRLSTDGPVDPALPLQVMPLGRAAGGAGEPTLAVSRSRDWLAVAGLPSPLEPLLRAAVGREHVGPLSVRSCPRLPPGVRPTAVAAGAADELILLAGDPATGTSVVSLLGPTGRCLLRLDTGLAAARGLACSPVAGTLWVTVSDHHQPEPRQGLWRLDATLVQGRQAIRPVLVSALPGARSVACPNERTVIVAVPAAAGDQGALVRVDVPAAMTMAREAMARGHTADTPRDAP
jgi:hypothetical protein